MIDALFEYGQQFSALILSPRRDRRWQFLRREALLRPLTLVAGVVERRQTLPVLSNVLLEVQDNQLSLTGTDLEVELIGRTEPNTVDEPGSATVPARKLMDICKSLPEQSEIQFVLEDGRAVLRSGRSRFTL